MIRSGVKDVKIIIKPKKSSLPSQVVELSVLSIAAPKAASEKNDHEMVFTFYETHCSRCAQTRRAACLRSGPAGGCIVLFHVWAWCWPYPAIFTARKRASDHVPEIPSGGVTDDQSTGNFISRLVCVWIAEEASP